MKNIEADTDMRDTISRGTEKKSGGDQHRKEDDDKE
jgi:uncharacterized protein YqfA (UPF0365 family)